MRQVIIRDRSKELVHAIIGIRTGWRHEVPGKTGIAHYMEHAAFLGNRTYPSPDNEVGRYGVQFEGMTLPEHTLFFFTCARADFAKMLRTLMSLVFHPQFVEDELEKEKQKAVITSVIQECDCTPWELAHDLAKNLLFDWDFMTSLGTKEDVASTTGEDLAAWHKRHYHAANSFVLIHGDVPEGELPRLIDAAEVPSGGEMPSPRKVHHGTKTISVKRTDTAYTEMVYGFGLGEYDVRWEVLRVLLGNYATSILWEDRFASRTYTVGSGLEWTATGGGFLVYLGATSADNAREVDQRLWHLLEDFEIGEEQVEIAKKIRSVEILKMKEGGERGLRSFFLCDPHLKYGGFHGLIEAIERVEKAEILTLVERHLNRNRAARATVGPERDLALRSDRAEAC